MGTITELIGRFQAEAATDEQRKAERRERFEAELRKQCEGKACDVVFVEQFARESSTNPAKFIQNAIDRCNEAIRVEGVKAEIAECEADMEKAWATIREHTQKRDTLKDQAGRITPYDSYSELRADAKLEQVDEYRDLRRKAAWHDDRITFARREISRLESKIKQLRESLELAWSK